MLGLTEWEGAARSPFGTKTLSVLEGATAPIAKGSVAHAHCSGWAGVEDASCVAMDTSLAA